jgi:hypothetical protein
MCFTVRGYMYKNYQIIRLVVVLAAYLSGFQAHAAALRIKNERKTEPIAIQVEQLGLASGSATQPELIYILRPGETREWDAVLGGYGKMKWYGCGKGYELDLNIAGVDGWADINIGEGPTIFRTQSRLEPQTAMQGKKLKDIPPCDCEIQGL